MAKQWYQVNDSFEVVLTVKDDDVRRDFKRLCEIGDVGWDRRFDRRSGSDCPMPTPFYLYSNSCCGQLLSHFFHYKDRLASGAQKKESANELIKRWREDPRLYESAMKRASADNKSPEEIRYKALEMNSALYSLTHFRASVSFDLCGDMGAKTVLDSCGGWGDRLTGFLASRTVERIVIVEPRQSAIDAYKKQHEFVQSSKTLITHCGKAEEVLPTIEEEFDLIITSPPYFNLETYRSRDGEKVEHHPNLDTFRDTFLQPMLEQQARLLRDGGLLAINVDDNVKEGVDICEFTIATLEKAGLSFVCTSGLDKGNGIGNGNTSKSLHSAEPIYMFTKGRALPTYTGAAFVPPHFRAVDPNNYCGGILSLKRPREVAREVVYFSW